MTLSDLMLSSQIDDFKNEIKRQHRSLDEFDVSATPLRLDEASGALSAYRGTVTIKLRKTGVERSYETATPRRGLCSFPTILKGGVFGQPREGARAARWMRKGCAEFLTTQPH